MITIRNYRPSDAPVLWDVFYQTVRNVNTTDYSEAEVKAWANDDRHPSSWQSKMDSIAPFIAEMNGEIVGYADLQNDGLIDHFFCHYKHQGLGVGRRLMEHIFNVGKSKGLSRYLSEVSITARPFYEKHGFKVVKEQTVEIRGQKLRNFLMEKIAEEERRR
ncbi:GNAT family N-acetyltransferase [Pseudidiomarina marina]|uniref:GNAT family N-acetyltransferase n=1 Tax=Pseudidiomarina marina TaxID=502366 RepID=UPI00384E5129